MTQRSFYPKASSKQDNRTIYFKIRITPEEDALIRKRAAAFGSISCFIRSALIEFSNPHSKEILNFINELSFFYFNDADSISAYGDCLNNSVKRVNELAKAGKLTVDDIERGPMRQIQYLRQFLTEVKNDIDAVIENAKKNGIQIR